MTPREPTALEMTIVGELLTIVRWIESLPDEELDPDVALKPLEWLGYALGNLAPEDRATFIDAARRLPEAPRGPTPEEVEASLAAFGLLEESGAFDNEPVPSPPELDDPPWLRAPTPAELLLAPEAAARAIGHWLGKPDAFRGVGGYVRAEPPASEADIAGLEEREHFQVPSAYRDLLLATNGITIAGIELYGTRDAQRLDRPGPDRLVVSFPLDQDTALTLAPTGELVLVGLGDQTSDGRILASDLRAWFAAELAKR